MKGLLAIETLYHQIVACNKTQTRRSGGLEEVNDTSQQMNGHIRSPDDCTLLETKYANNGKLKAVFDKPNSTVLLALFSRYAVGEVLYLKEPISVEKFNGKHLYKFRDTGLGSEYIKWQNKLFMPASAARAFVKITGIKCERLLDISDEDCTSEGIIQHHVLPDKWINYLYPQFGTFATNKDGSVFFKKNNRNPKWQLTAHANTPIESFISLYKFANKMSPKKEVPNLWVWVYSFEYLKDYQP